ncbi:hypothetical protein [Puerhibacterium puerhi]|uniref:hypothetical protein n=1 Tax=Puerhibacterium puerhi TaxID=2692623 RepID=UPI0013573C3C|nr:hypothetical protein [Puerhibacterium puerhi]
MTARPARRTPAAVAAGALTLALALTGCAAEPPAPNPDPSASGPVLSEDQDTHVLGEVNAVLQAASESNDPTKLEARLTGPALAIRTSQLEVAKARGNADLVTDIPGEYQQLIVPTNDTWPRTSFAITVQTEELQTPRLLALEQASPRDPYRLWGWVQLASGITMPAFADAELGSENLAADDDSLLVSPQDAVNQYADVLTTGSGSAFKDTFEDDAFRQLLGSFAQTQKETLDQPNVDGTYTLEVTPTKDQPVKAVRTADGGAMVMAALTATETMTAVEGATLTPPTRSGKALLGDAEPTNKLVDGYSDMVALYVPPKGADAKVKLLGYSHIQTSVSTE